MYGEEKAALSRNSCGQSTGSNFEARWLVVMFTFPCLYGCSIAA
jgi:hypothetical protein